MLDGLKKQVFDANLELVRQGLVLYTWGNASAIDRSQGLVVIKPSGVSYERMDWTDMVVVDAGTGTVVEGRWKPSSDTPTHLELYRAFEDLGGVVHTHSTNATAFAQAGKEIPALGTTQADYFYGAIPCTRLLTREETETDYERNTGKVIVETLRERNLPVLAVPGIVVRNHGPFAWGKDAAEAVYHATVLERVAEMDIKTLLLNPHSLMPSYILDKHYQRKHGAHAYYGQGNHS